MKIENMKQKRALLIEIEGDIDHHNCEKMRREIQNKVKKTKAIHLIFDFKSVHFMDSSGIGFLIGRYKECENLGGKILISNANHSILRILSMAGLTKIIETKKNKTEAKKAISD